VKKHFCDIKNELAYFKKVVKNMDLDDIKNERKHIDNDIHYEEFLDENSIDIFQIMTESKYKGSLSWIDLIQNEKLHRAIEKLTEEEKYLITLLFYENRTQEELADFYNVRQPAIYHKINKIIRKIKFYLSKK
jgi:DNA-directed RNA polymerase specialized sigma subunit, sigma24 homolog